MNPGLQVRRSDERSRLSSGSFSSRAEQVNTVLKQELTICSVELRCVAPFRFCGFEILSRNGHLELMRCRQSLAKVRNSSEIVDHCVDQRGLACSGSSQQENVELATAFRHCPRCASLVVVEATVGQILSALDVRWSCCRMQADKMAADRQMLAVLTFWRDQLASCLILTVHIPT